MKATIAFSDLLHTGQSCSAMPNGINIEFAHSERQKKFIKDYIKVYGLDNYGLGNILGTQSNVNNFYRRVAAC